MDYIDLHENRYYDITLRIVHFKLTDETYECLITNLPQEDYPGETLKELYAKRWGIETSFRELKYAIGVTAFHAKKAEYIKQEIRARMILYNFCEIITAYITVSDKKCGQPFSAGHDEKHLAENHQGAVRRCLVTVKKASHFLHNLHIPSETITENSLTLLWNRSALTDVSGLAFYRIICENYMISETTQLGFTIKELSPHTGYSFTVCAVGKDGKLIISQEISARTRHSGVVLNVLDKPFCADGTGRHNDTLAIRRVIDACPDGGTVLLPKGHTFYCGALFLKKSYDLSGRRNFICLR